MRTLPRPPFSTEDVLLDCISNYRDPDLHIRFLSSKEEIVEWSEILENKIKAHTVSTIESDKCIPQNISKSEMIKLYNDKFSKKGQPGRLYYNDIMDLPKYRLCPLCGYRPVDSLDHYLPKDLFPALSIIPINLIPACFPCNKRKQTSRPSSAEEEFLHPYFDNIEDKLWLYSEVLEELPLTVVFKVQPHNEWDEITSKRVKYHFKKFHLGQQFSSYAGNELSGKIFRLKESFDQGGSSVVRDELLKEKESYRFSKLNSWETALYSALYDSNWFCEEALKHSISELLG
ncbi:hypothetical protein [Bacillus sp. MUM 13]|uniref:HNH endonuclease n=1 Tax=Bacillus sp. MUM 13 TaxID=1678001 RepID=UPI0008F5E1FE|nr:hypothetical protein [Bacillus sp. MUM 13]OIK08810.1 hypothetical protein BIV59_18675 [Bacillus sp. MUM 13]